MPSSRVTASAAVVLLGAACYAIYLQPFLAFLVGLNRTLQPLSDFPFACRRLYHPLLEGCEDLFLDDDARKLYLACAGTASRLEWNPGGGKFNYSGRRQAGAHIAVLDIDSIDKDDFFGARKLKVQGFDGESRNGLDTVGFDGEIINDNLLRLWIVNMGPSRGENGQMLDPKSAGANATIEVFDVPRHGDTMVHAKTFLHDAIQTPNRVAATRDGGFVMTNDKSAKVGIRKELDLFLGGGSLTYCSSSGCHIGANSGFSFPNGLARGLDGLYYVPNIFSDKINVMELQADKSLKEVRTVRVGMPVDNLSVDKHGDIFAAAFPKVLSMIESLADPLNLSPPSTIWRIRRSSDGYEISKVLEDRDGEVVAGATTAIHDSKTGRLFIGGVVTPFISVCDPK